MSDYERLGNFAYLLKTAFIMSLMTFNSSIVFLIINVNTTIDPMNWIVISCLIFSGLFFILGLVGIYLFYKTYKNHQDIVNENLKNTKEH